MSALPDVWPTGSISSLRARGGFEIVSMEWKDGKLTRVVVKSNVGGNLRLRVPNALTGNEGALAKASGPNRNLFYTVGETPSAIVSPKAGVTAPSLTETQLYDLPTQRGKVYTLVAK